MTVVLGLPVPALLVRPDMTKKKRAPTRQPTVEEVHSEVQALRHRHLLLGCLIAELEQRFGGQGEEVDFLRVDSNYEPARRDVVEQLLNELIRAQDRAHRRCRELAGKAVDVEVGELGKAEQRVFGA